MRPELGRRARVLLARFVNLKTDTAMNEKETPQNGGNGVSQAEDTAQSGVELVETPESIALERDRLAGEKTELQNALLRLAAEFDNSRKRIERERAELIEYASADALKALLPVVDDFERALKNHAALHGKGAEFVKGIELIYQRMVDALKKMGVEPIVTEGQLFDPNIHEAIERVPTEEAEDQAIVGEYQRGYQFKGKLLRPAMVRVAVRP